MIASRFLLIPVLAAVGYEILRFGARYRSNRLVKVIMYPGILVQMITTKRPEDDMIEVAITSMQEALVADGNAVPAGSTDFERSTIDFGPKNPERRRRTRRTCHADRRTSLATAAPPAAPAALADADEPPAIA